MNPVERRDFLRRLGVLFGSVATTACGGSSSGGDVSVTTGATPVGGSSADTVGVGSMPSAATTDAGTAVRSAAVTSAPATGALADEVSVMTSPAGTASPSTPAVSAAPSPNSAVASPPQAPAHLHLHPWVPCNSAWSAPKPTRLHPSHSVLHSGPVRWRQGEPSPARTCRACKWWPKTAGRTDRSSSP